jgi:hypothetical protein
MSVDESNMFFISIVRRRRIEMILIFASTFFLSTPNFHFFLYTSHMICSAIS